MPNKVAHLCLINSAVHFYLCKPNLGRSRLAKKPRSSSNVNNVLAANDVRRKLVAVLTPVSANVTLEGLPETVAAHVDGEHDVIQEEHAAVIASERFDGSPLSVHHTESLPGGGGGRGGRAGRWDRSGDLSHEPCVFSVRLSVFGVEELHRVRSLDVVVMDDVMDVVDLHGSGAVAWFVGHAFGVGGVLAAVAR